jgi:hypothetical protein
MAAAAQEATGKEEDFLLHVDEHSFGFQDLSSALPSILDGLPNGGSRERLNRLSVLSFLRARIEEPEVTFKLSNQRQLQRTFDFGGGRNDLCYICDLTVHKTTRSGEKVLILEKVNIRRKKRCGWIEQIVIYFSECQSTFTQVLFGRDVVNFWKDWEIQIACEEEKIENSRFYPAKLPF